MLCTIPCYKVEMTFFFAHSNGLILRWGAQKKFEEQNSQKILVVLLSFVALTNPKNHSECVNCTKKEEIYKTRVMIARFSFVFSRFAGISYTSEKCQQRDMAFHYQDYLRATIEYVFFFSIHTVHFPTNVQIPRKTYKVAIKS